MKYANFEEFLRGKYKSVPLDNRVGFDLYFKSVTLNGWLKLGDEYLKEQLNNKGELK